MQYLQYATNLPRHVAAMFEAERANELTELQVFAVDDGIIDAAPPVTFANIRVLEGTPLTRALELAKTADEKIAAGVWSCTAGRLHISYLFDEVIYILDGQVTLYVDGEARTLRAGDMALMPVGLQAIWDIPVYVRKVWVMHRPERGIFRRVADKALRVAQKLFNQRPPAML